MTNKQSQKTPPSPEYLQRITMANAKPHLGQFYIEVASDGKRSEKDFAKWLTPKDEERWSLKDRKGKNAADADARNEGRSKSLYVPKTSFIHQAKFFDTYEEAEAYRKLHFRRGESYTCRFLGAEFSVESFIR